ncbi:MAG: DUF4383 domain-containing protein [bacterium]|nr:DUF4383 domain-containing protein [bacterium]MDZ4296592.1 DUF4383 domain-containing protein [Patescibacteria group bacterium]
MNPKQFLLAGGIVLIALALYGFLVPQTPGSFFWLDAAENWAHLVFGVVALIAYFALPQETHGPLVLVVGLVALIVTIYGFLVDTNLLGANLENPADNILHLVVAVWAFYAWWNGRKSVAPSMPMQM